MSADLDRSFPEESHFLWFMMWSRKTWTGSKQTHLDGHKGYWC